MSKKATTKLATKLAVTEGKLSAERMARVRTSALLDEALAGLPGEATAPAPAPAPPVASVLAKLKALPAGSVERLVFLDAHRDAILAESDAERGIARR